MRNCAFICIHMNSVESFLFIVMLYNPAFSCFTRKLNIIIIGAWSELSVSEEYSSSFPWCYRPSSSLFNNGRFHISEETTFSRSSVLLLWCTGANHQKAFAAKSNWDWDNQRVFSGICIPKQTLLLTFIRHRFTRASV